MRFAFSGVNSVKPRKLSTKKSDSFHCAGFDRMAEFAMCKESFSDQTRMKDLSSMQFKTTSHHRSLVSEDEMNSNPCD